MNNHPPTLAERQSIESCCNTSELLDWEWRTRLSHYEHWDCPMCGQPANKTEYVELIRENGHLDAFVRRHCACGFIWTTQTQNEYLTEKREDDRA